LVVWMAWVNRLEGGTELADREGPRKRRGKNEDRVAA
jgi:hypothetical protein